MGGHTPPPSLRVRDTNFSPFPILDLQTLFFNVFDSPSELFDEPIFITVGLSCSPWVMGTHVSWQQWDVTATDLSAIVPVSLCVCLGEEGWVEA